MKGVCIVSVIVSAFSLFALMISCKSPNYKNAIYKGRLSPKANNVCLNLLPDSSYVFSYTIVDVGSYAHTYKYRGYYVIKEDSLKLTLDTLVTYKTRLVFPGDPPREFKKEDLLKRRATESEISSFRTGEYWLEPVYLVKKNGKELRDGNVLSFEVLDTDLICPNYYKYPHNYD